MLLYLDETSPEPLYAQIYRYIKSEIIAGTLKPGMKIPSKRQLASELVCGLNTVQSAYAQLIDEGYIEARARSGYYVNEIENMAMIKRASDEHNDRETVTKNDVIDCSYNSVSEEGFPFSAWRRTLKDVLYDQQDRFLLAGDSLGDENFRREIAVYLHQSRGVHCSWEQIVISSGTEYLMQMLIHLCSSDSCFALEDPGYEKFRMIIQSNDACFVPISLDHSGMLANELEQSVATIAVVSPSHQFPCGMIMPISRRLELLAWANQSAERYLIEDDYDSEFKYEGKPIPSLQSLDQNGKVIYVGSFSKCLSPSIRVSYMVLPQHLLQRYQSEMSFYQCPVSSLVQQAIASFMKGGHFERHLNRMRTIYKKKREFLSNAITSSLPGVRILGANAGLHLVIEIDCVCLEEELVDSAFRAGVRVYGISEFHLTQDHHAMNPRILIGFASLSLKDIETMVQVLKQAWMSGSNRL